MGHCVCGIYIRRPQHYRENNRKIQNHLAISINTSFDIDTCITKIKACASALLCCLICELFASGTVTCDYCCCSTSSTVYTTTLRTARTLRSAQTKQHSASALLPISQNRGSAAELLAQHQDLKLCDKLRGQSPRSHLHSTLAQDVCQDESRRPAGAPPTAASENHAVLAISNA